MRYAFILLFMAVPLAEIALLVKFGQVFGFWATIGLVVGTAILGGAVLHSQGLRALTRIQASAEKGEAPIGPVIDAGFIALAGFLLVTPGVITDSIGLLLLIPPIRRRIALVVVRWALRNSEIRVETFRRERARTPPPGDEMSDGPVIDVKAERLDERPMKPTGSDNGSGRPNH
ncbi:MAG TPA: FxsA family protein [Hyphomicrobiaceae bacterium]|nr:FxsA family protein [Hyphomicrobiaceae bacterium]